jgi:hypothetical protein
MSSHDELPNIDPSALDDVSGATGSGSTSTDDPIATALQGIQQSLADLKSNSGNNNNSFAQMLPLMMLLFSGPSGGFGGFGGFSGGCGCGMPGCGRCGR